MLSDLVQRLACPECRVDGHLAAHAFAHASQDRIKDGVLVCCDCRAWYPIDDELLELVPRPLMDGSGMARFCARWRSKLDGLGLRSAYGDGSQDFVAQLKQRQHFDWYADNEEQKYLDYAKTPFWESVDALTFHCWRAQIRPGAWLLDIGCANGRSAFPMAETGATVAGCDISKKMIRQAIQQARKRGLARSTTFFVADGNDLPLASDRFDYALTYGVLHHLPDPGRTCGRIQKILKPGGVFFGSENNKTIFRRVFDLLMKFKPLWTEEAGCEPLISRQMIDHWHAGLGVRIHSATRVFVPPHLLNFIGRKAARWLLDISDRAASSIPGLCGQGGLIVFEVHKPACDKPSGTGHSTAQARRACAA
jgi:SAM-dependent methyltransferase/uncharacterized protein YbaR (Trm112 family)